MPERKIPKSGGTVACPCNRLIHSHGLPLPPYHPGVDRESRAKFLRQRMPPLVVRARYRVGLWIDGLSPVVNHPGSFT